MCNYGTPAGVIKIQFKGLHIWKAEAHSDTCDALNSSVAITSTSVSFNIATMAKRTSNSERKLPQAKHIQLGIGIPRRPDVVMLKLQVVPPRHISMHQFAK